MFGKQVYRRSTPSGGSRPWPARVRTRCCPGGTGRASRGHSQVVGEPGHRDGDLGGQATPGPHASRRNTYPVAAREGVFTSRLVVTSTRSSPVEDQVRPGRPGAPRLIAPREDGQRVLDGAVARPGQQPRHLGNPRRSCADRRGISQSWPAQRLACAVTQAFRCLDDAGAAGSPLNRLRCHDLALLHASASPVCAGGRRRRDRAEGGRRGREPRGFRRHPAAADRSAPSIMIWATIW